MSNLEYLEFVGWNYFADHAVQGGSLVHSVLVDGHRGHVLPHCTLVQKAEYRDIGRNATGYILGINFIVHCNNGSDF